MWRLLCCQHQGRRQSIDRVNGASVHLCNMEHRGATGAEADTGDGAGILVQMPDRFLRSVVTFVLPPAGSYAAGMAFLPADADLAEKAVAAIERIASDEGLRVLGWRLVPIEPDCLGASARSVMPGFQQLFLADTATSTRTRVGPQGVHCTQAN